MYGVLSAIQWVAGILLLLIQALLKADPSQWRLGSDLLVWLQQWSWAGTSSMLVTVGLAQIGRKAIGPPRVWEAVHHLLDKFQEHVFRNQGGPLHHHRVTLFKYVPYRLRFCRWPWDGWLIPVERSGHATRKTRTVFRVPDNADYVEGVAGQVWAGNAALTVDNLPDISDCLSDSDLETYAQQTWTSTSWLRKKQQYARFFCGIPVEVKGKLWGVMVLDSRFPQPFKNTNANSKFFSTD